MAAYPIVEMTQGDTSDIWAVGHPTSAPGNRIVLANLTGWTCRISVRNTDDSVAMAARDVTEKDDAGTRFLAYLLPAETAALASGEYKVGVQIRNPTGTFIKESHFPLRIVREAVS